MTPKVAEKFRKTHETYKYRQYKLVKVYLEIGTIQIPSWYLFIEPDKLVAQKVGEDIMPLAWIDETINSLREYARLG